MAIGSEGGVGGFGLFCFAAIGEAGGCAIINCSSREMLDPASMSMGDGGMIVCSAVSDEMTRAGGLEATESLSTGIWSMEIPLRLLIDVLQQNLLLSRVHTGAGVRKVKCVVPALTTSSRVLPNCKKDAPLESSLKIEP